MNRTYIFTVLIVTLLSHAYGSDEGDNDYGIMIDAGSSGSRISIYMWSRRSVNDAQLPNLEEAPVGQVPWSNKTTPGISNYTDPHAAAKSLDVLIDFAKSKLPPTKWYSTILFLKATAGMRLLPPSQQDAIMEAVRDYLQTTPFHFQRSWAKIIPGTEEGVYGWVSVNYLMNAFSQYSNSSTVSTYGALDLGGASTQITFVPTTKPAYESYNLTFSNSVSYDLYSHSFLGYGNDQVRDAVVRRLINDHNDSSHVPNPCLPIGYTTTFSYNNSVYTLEGSSDYAVCKEYTVAQLNLSAPCPTGNCSFDGVYQPEIPTEMTFYAFSGYYYVWDLFGLQNTNSSLDIIESQTSQLCSMTWDDIREKYKNFPNQKFLMNYCFMGTYVISLLHDGYKFPLNTTQIISVNQLKNIEVSWTLGAMLYEADIVPWFKHCDDYTSCSGCTSNPACGWCYRNELCLPGDDQQAFENGCEDGWKHKSDGCARKNSPPVIILFVTVVGIVLILIGVVGLIMLYRRRSLRKGTYEVLLQDE